MKIIAALLLTIFIVAISSGFIYADLRTNNSILKSSFKQEETSNKTIAEDRLAQFADNCHDRAVYDAYRAKHNL